MANDGLRVNKLELLVNPTYTTNIVMDNGTKTGLVSTTNVKKIMQYTSVIGTPSIVGMAGTISIAGSDAAHSVSLNTSVSPAPDATIATITFGQAYSVTPTVVFSPTNNAASKLPYINRQIYIVATTTGYVINAGDGGFPGFSTCTFNVIVQI